MAAIVAGKGEPNSIRRLGIGDAGGAMEIGAGRIGCSSAGGLIRSGVDVAGTGEVGVTTVGMIGSGAVGTAATCVRSAIRSSSTLRSSIFESEGPYANVDLNSKKCAGSMGLLLARSLR